jgi:hypothetical protein
VTVTENPAINQPNPAPAPELADFPAYDSASDAIGLLPGSFRVDESGAATYSIPIGTVAGSGGVAPVVSLDYSSQGGNGVVGVGFRLSGASVITRCRQTKETDNTAMGAVTFTSSDRFCLDGARLVLMSGNYGAPGAAYRTEIDSFTKVVSNGSQGGGPQSFTVWRKDGSVTQYGVTDDARIEAFGTDSAVFAWAQNKFSDSAGNYLEFEYLEDTSNGIEFGLDTIRYTGNDSALTSPSAELRFLYDDTRPDKTRGYFAGMALKQTQRLTDIESWASPPSGGAMTLIERTTLDYEAAPTSNLSRLTSVTRCGPTVCLEPTTFTWQDAGGGFEAGASETYHTRYFRGGKPADIDGDGDADLVWLRINNAGEPKIEIMRSENGRLISQGQESAPTPQKPPPGRSSTTTTAGGVISPGAATGYGSGPWMAATPLAAGQHRIPIDNNRTGCGHGNGLADMVHNAGALYWRLLNKSGSSYAFGTAQTLTLAPAPGDDPLGLQSLDAIRPVVADFNGDGLVDLLLKAFVSPWCEPELGPCPPGANYWRLYTRDPGTTTFRYCDTLALDTASTDQRITLGDINGDGLTDVAYAEGTGNVWKYRLSSGTALGTPTTIVTLASTTERTALADFNGDGRQDFLYTANGTWYARLATETGLSATATNTGLPSTESGYGGQQSGWLGYFHDVNGDGRADYSRFFLGDDTAFTNAYAARRRSISPMVPRSKRLAPPLRSSTRRLPIRVGPALHQVDRRPARQLGQAHAGDRSLCPALCGETGAIERPGGRYLPGSGR